MRELIGFQEHAYFVRKGHPGYRVHDNILWLQPTKFASVVHKLKSMGFKLVKTNFLSDFSMPKSLLPALSNPWVLEATNLLSGCMPH